VIIISSLDAPKSIRETEKKNLKPLSSGQKNPQKPKKTKKTNKIKAHWAGF
jgi:hypothetical protein